MQGLYHDGNKACLRNDLPIPEPLSHESLIRISLAAICNTDREIIRGYKPDFRGVLGHEFVGVVEKSGNAELIGKRVVGELNEGCGECLYCRTGREHHCVKRKCIGMAGRDGCFAPYMTIATRLLHTVPDGLADEQAVFTEPLAAAFEIADQVHIRPSDEICVIGDGRLSFMIAQVLSLTGAEVTVLGKHEDKLKRFEKFAKTAVKCSRQFETVVEATGSPKGFEDALRLVRSRGTIILKSTYAGNANINLSQITVNEITLVGSRCGPFEPALRFLSRGLVDLPPIELYKLSDWE
ncbi:MAG: alcohol dehydrogenase catalytic domain-containing protein, partial [Clostridiales bacterium]|nr:alcohol dehydrogenase catalytic domain-containing protein [Clostridiales bacterium]